MSAPTIVVNVALNVPSDTDFILDDDVRGELDGTYTLSTGYTDVTADSVSASISRGRFSQLWDSADAGRASVTVNNESRDYDPAHMPSPYAGFIVPGRQTQITANNIPIWTGWVDDWQLSYSVDGRSTATMLSTDALGVLGKLQFDAWTSSGTNVQAKLTNIVYRDEVSWDGPIDFDTGTETLQADSVTWGSNVLAYCNLVARSELGLFFAAADGTLAFRNRTSMAGDSVASFTDDGSTFEAPLLDSVGEPLVDGDGNPLTGTLDTIPYSNIAATIGSELLFARVGVDREGGTAQSSTVADTTTWRDLYGPLRSLTISGLLLSTNAASLAMAEYLLLLYDTPRYRVTEVSIMLHALTEVQQEVVLAVDICDSVTVAFTPNDTGSAITQPLMVQGIRHDISPMSHRVTFSLTEGSTPYFRLDSATYGVLDDDRLGF